MEGGGRRRRDERSGGGGVGRENEISQVLFREGGRERITWPTPSHQFCLTVLYRSI